MTSLGRGGIHSPTFMWPRRDSDPKNSLGRWGYVRADEGFGRLLRIKKQLAFQSFERRRNRVGSSWRADEQCTKAQKNSHWNTHQTATAHSKARENQHEPDTSPPAITMLHELYTVVKKPLRGKGKYEVRKMAWKTKYLPPKKKYFTLKENWIILTGLFCGGGCLMFATKRKGG